MKPDAKKKVIESLPEAASTFLLRIFVHGSVYVKSRNCTTPNTPEYMLLKNDIVQMESCSFDAGESYSFASGKSLLKLNPEYRETVEQYVLETRPDLMEDDEEEKDDFEDEDEYSDDIYIHPIAEQTISVDDPVQAIKELSRYLDLLEMKRKNVAEYIRQCTDKL